MYLAEKEDPIPPNTPFHSPISIFFSLGVVLERKRER